MDDLGDVLEVAASTSWPWAELLARFALLLIGALLLDRGLIALVRRAGLLGLDRRGGLAPTLPVARALLLLAVFLGTLAPLHADRPESAALLALLALGLATAWALPHLRDVAGGLVLALRRPFAVGQAVDLDGVVGQVASIGLTGVALLTVDGQQVWVPARQLHAGRVRVAAGGARALPIAVEVSVGADAAALERLQDEALLSPYLDLSAPVRVDRVAATTARMVATPTHFCDEGLLEGDLVERAARAAQ